MEREREGTVKVGACGGGCQKHTDTRSCLQLPGPQSFNKLPTGILKLEAAFGHTRRAEQSRKSILVSKAVGPFFCLHEKV